MVVIMIAGIASLGNRIFGLPRAVGSAIATALIMVTVYFGFDGMVRVFEFVIPVLFLAMYGNANATMVAALNYFDKRLPHGKEKKGRILRIVLAGAVAYVCSLTGFTKLVATVYPVIGYIGAASILLLLEHAVSLARKKKNGNEEKNT